MLLDKISSPTDLRKLKRSQLEKVAAEVRACIIDNISKIGGHFAANLGTVELAVALHYSFDTPTDKIVWDVGHQAYPHKILTGRRDRINTIRKHNGISPFLKRSESPYDEFGAGHASTSISAAIGIACARDLKNESFHTVAVIGDGALTGGMALEGLNHSGYLNKDILIILNDNEWSINRNVGALAQHSKRIKNTEAYNSVRFDYHKISEGLPRKYRRYLTDLKKHLLTLLTPDLVFTKLGFHYSGPVDGHDVLTLVDTLDKLKKVKGPKLLHIHTIKGKGYKYAEEDALEFHGVSPFDLTTGKKNGGSSQKSYTEVFTEIMIKLAKSNPKIVAITPAMSAGSGLDPFQMEFPDRHFDVGIAEQHAVTFSAGLATQGMIPVAAIYSTFLQRAFDQILHDVCLQQLRVIIAIDRGGIVGEDGPTHHGNFDISYLLLMPNLRICAPKDENELQDLLYSATLYDGPTAVRYPKGPGPGTRMMDIPSFIEPGSSELLSKGDDIVLVGYGSTVHLALKAREALLRKGISASVINARFAKPIDIKLINHIKRIKKAVIAEENAVIGGLGAEIMRKVNSGSVKYRLIGLPDSFIEHGAREILLEKYGLSVQNIVDNAMQLIR